jgi:serine acetyltransferase
MKALKKDLLANKNFYSKIITLILYAERSKLSSIIWPIKKIIYIVLNIELPHSKNIGKGLVLPHPYNIIINKKVIIGENCRIYHNTTIGNNDFKNGSPVIGSHCYLGTNSSVIGPIVIGDNCFISAHSLITNDLDKNLFYSNNQTKKNNIKIHELYR